MSAQFTYLIPDALDTHSALLYKIAYNTLGFSPGGGGTVTVTLPSGNTTEDGATVTSNGATAAGVYNNITFLAGSGATVTVSGAPIAAGASLTRTAPLGQKLGAITYTVSGGNLYLIRSA